VVALVKAPPVLPATELKGEFRRAAS